MEIQEIREKIQSDEDFVLSEVQNILTYYQLKHTLRWSHDSTEVTEKESVAEHIYGLSILCDYFLPLQQTELDTGLVRELILWHDMSEALVDDTTTMAKTDEHKRLESEAETKLAETAPDHMKKRIGELFTIYEAQNTPEAQFVKALDKLEPLFHILFTSQKIQYTDDFKKRQLTHEILEKYQNDRLKYISDYSEILTFSVIISKEIVKTNYIHPEA